MENKCRRPTVTKVTVMSKTSFKMAERFDGKKVLELLFDDDFDLPDGDDSEDEDAGESSYLGEKALDHVELRSLSEAVGIDSVDGNDYFVDGSSSCRVSASTSSEYIELENEDDDLENELLGKFQCIYVKSIKNITY